MLKKVQTRHILLFPRHLLRLLHPHLSRYRYRLNFRVRWAHHRLPTHQLLQSRRQLPTRRKTLKRHTRPPNSLSWQRLIPLILMKADLGKTHQALTVKNLSLDVHHDTIHDHPRPCLRHYYRVSVEPRHQEVRLQPRKHGEHEYLIF